MRLIPAAGLLAGCALAVSSLPLSAQTLSEAMAAAYQNNPQLQAERARQRATDEDVSRAWGGYRPQVTVNAEKGRAQDKIRYPDPQSPTGSLKVGDYRSPDSEAVQLRQEIWDGQRTFADVQHSKMAVENGLAILRSVEQSVLGSVAQVYYDLYRDQHILAIQKEYVRSLEDEQKAVMARFKVKDVTQTDVAQAEARLARGIADQQQYAGNVEASKSAFLRITGLPAGNMPPLPPLPTGLPEDFSDLMALVENNPDYRAAVFAEKAAQADITYAESGLLPDISVQATSSRANQNDTNRSTNFGNTVTLNLVMPLYDGGVAAARTRAAKHTAGQRRLNVDQQRDVVIDQIRQAWESLKAVRARAASLRETERAAGVALTGVQQELHVGSRTILDELNARQEILDTQINLERAHHDEAIATYTLLIACGRATADNLQLPVEAYDPREHYEGVNWLPWVPWIGTDYPEAVEAAKVK